jgi:hypothetical protein
MDLRYEMKPGHCRRCQLDFGGEVIVKMSEAFGYGTSGSYA